VVHYTTLEPYKTASLGSYIKVAGATITSANIAAEYAKILKQFQ
jgi:hypothetical protein